MQTFFTGTRVVGGGMVELSCPNCGTEWETEADEQAKASVHCPECDYKVQLPGK